MIRNRDDSVVWIGYTDFLTTLAVLFFIAFLYLQSSAGDGVVRGTVVLEATGQPVRGAEVALAGRYRATSGVDGRFIITVESIVDTIVLNLKAVSTAPDAWSDTLVAIGPGETHEVTVRLRQASTVEVTELPGDALFELNSYALKPEGADKVAEVGRSWHLGPDELLVVKGHTDDQPFPAGYGMDNWMLSGLRAAAAARVLRERVGIPEVRIRIMGYGPSKPKEQVLLSDPPLERQRKRASNRRIEFIQMKSKDL